MKSFLLLFISVLILSAVSCSSGSNPTTPSNTNEPQSSISHNLPYTPIINHSVDGVTAYQAVFGAWKINIDIKNLSAEIIPARKTSAIGDIFDADLSQFLTVSPCETCLMIGRVYIDGYGLLNIQFGMKHPFSNIATRPDLHGFDVRGILIVPADLSSDYPNITLTRPDGTEEGAWPSTGVILNADGYTSHFDEISTDTRYFTYGSDVPGNINPFLRFFEDYATPTFDPHNPDGHNVMKVGAGLYTRTTVFSKEASELENLYLYFVADVAYGQSAVLANRTNPQYYLPAFNRTEPWRVEYWIENNNLNMIDPASTADVVVQVFDWQHNATVDPDYPNPGNLSGIPESSKVASVELLMPGLQDDVLVQTTPESGTGSPTDPLQYRFTVTNEISSAYECEMGILAIRDELNEQAAPHGRIPIPVSPAGFPYETQDIRDYSMYEVIYVNIFNGYLPTSNEVEYSQNNEIFILARDLLAWAYNDTPTTVLHPTFFMDPSHKKFQYRWETDEDGLFDDGGGLPSPVLSYPTGGRKDVRLRIRTNSVPPREYIYDFQVYFAEESYNNAIPSIGLNEDTTSRRGSHALYELDGNFYVTYLHESGGQRDVWLSIWNRNGLVTNVPVTNDSASEYNPVIYVKDGYAEGIYIAYKVRDAMEDIIYSTHGNLDGSGFEPSNVSEVDSYANMLSDLCLIMFNNKLFIYYTYSWMLTNIIHEAHSNNWGDSWVPDGAVVNNGSSRQNDVTAAPYGWPIMDEGVILVWSDGINLGTTGYDLWYAQSDDGASFMTYANISSFTDATFEGYPSLDMENYEIRIAYVSEEVGDPSPNVRLKCYNLINGKTVDNSVSFGGGSDIDLTAPAIASYDYDYVLIAYGAYNTTTSELKAWVATLIHPNAVSGLGATFTWNESLGTVTSGESQIFPCVASNSPSYYAVENFVLYRDFTNGFINSPNAPTDKFCTVKGLYFVTPIEDYW